MKQEQKRSIMPYVLLAVGIIAFLVSFFLPHIDYPREPQKRVNCQWHLQNIGKAMRMHTNDYSDAMTYLWLTTNYFDPHSIFVCPSTGHKPGSFSKMTEWTDYVVNSRVTIESPSNKVIVYCPPKNHLGEGGNVLFVDGSVRWIDADVFWKTVRGIKK